MSPSIFLSQAEVDNYDRDGYVFIQDAFSQPEVDAMIASIEDGDSLEEHTHVRADAEGKRTKLAIWHTLKNDIWGAASTSSSLVNNARILLRQEVAFFHGKVMLKEAHTGGAWEWHQDYGYWYEQGFLYPRMLSAFVSLDPATRENGCISVLRGSHRIGRLNHVKIGSQFGVERERMALIEPLFERVYCEMEPGSALFFDSNLLHTSGANESDHPRRSFITAYNALGNRQLKEQLSADEICPIGRPNAVVEAGRIRTGMTDRRN
jgi:ectoine hydroxylase-related dioxygenase (phytanoyl-CoA dioxygenase family)